MTREQLNQLRKDKGITIEAMAKKTNLAEPTLKNLFYGKSKAPRIDTATPVAEMLGVEVSDILYSDVEDIKSTIEEMENPDAVSVIALKKIHEFQLDNMQEAHTAEMINTRAQYEQLIKELKTDNSQDAQHYERQLADTKALYEKIIAEKNDRISFLKKIIIFFIILVCVIVAVLFGVLIYDLSHLDRGWITH